METVAVKINTIRVFLSICAHFSGNHTLFMAFIPAYIRTSYFFHTNVFSSDYPINCYNYT